MKPDGKGVSAGDVIELDKDAESISAQGRTYPSRQSLRTAESSRVAITRIAREAQDVAVLAKNEEQKLVEDFKIARSEWEVCTRRKDYHVTSRRWPANGTKPQMRWRLCERLL